MAINKKLKKFDNNGTYRNFLTTSDFECPDVSSIGESDNPENLDVEYNPCSLFFLNAKARLLPTATKINFVIDTIVDGTVGCWYRASTGGTVTKLNSTDLTFYSAYTQNRISNLTFNTIGESNLSDEYNTVYILSARSTDGSIIATDECVQRGHIRLTGEMLAASGGSKTLKLKTAPGNPWKITNTNSWLTFSTLTGVGPTDITVTATEWTDIINPRIGFVTIEYTDMTYSRRLSIVQKNADLYFYVGNTLDEATTTACTYASIIDSADTSDKYVYYKMEGYNLTNLMIIADAWFESISFNGSTQIKFNLRKNSTEYNRTGTILIKDSETSYTLSQITVTQQGKRTPYFYVGNTLDEATTTACTYSSIIGSADTSDKYVYYNTNLTNEEIATLTFEKSSIIDDVNFVIPNTQIKFKCVENEEDEYFIFPDVGTNIRESVWKASRTFWQYPYETNMTGLSISYSDSWATVTLSNPNGSGTIDFSAPQNTTGINNGPSNYYVQQNGINIATITVEQTSGYVTFDEQTSHSAKTITITSDKTSFDETFASSLSGLTISPEETYSWISGLGINTPFVDDGGGILADPIPQSGSVSATTTVNANNYDRTAIFDIKCNNIVVGKLTVKQLAPLKELTFEILSAGTIYLTETATSSTYIGRTIEYSKDNGVTWTSITSNTGSSAPSISVVRGDKVYFRGNNDCYTINSGNCSVVFSASTGTKVNISGNINSLIQKENFNSVTSFTKDYVFYNLFSHGNWIVSVKDLAFPTMSITDYCYANMFSNQTNLFDVPSRLPATDLAPYCYRNMFYHCRGIGNVGYLELPATTLASYCYQNMFNGCISLTTAPELPATTLADGCYRSMFTNCIPLTTAPELPATDLAFNCYNGMFGDCTSLTTAPELPATTLAPYCYQNMFRGCSRLNYVKCLATDISADRCTYAWLSGVASTGRFIKHPNMTGWGIGENGIPNNWTVEDATL